MATGGSTADNAFVAGGTGADSTLPVPSARDQIAMFLSSHTVEPSDVFVHWTGANDVLFRPNITGAQLTSVVGANVDILYRNGAQNVLLPTYFPLDHLPATYGVVDYATLGNFTAQYTRGLENIAAAYSAYINIELVDVGALFSDMFANPVKYGLDPNYVNPPIGCLKGVYESEGVLRELCGDPEKHVFFDGYHPVKEVHARIGDLVKRVIVKSL